MCTVSHSPMWVWSFCFSGRAEHLLLALRRRLGLVGAEHKRLDSSVWWACTVPIPTPSALATHRPQA